MKKLFLLTVVFLCNLVYGQDLSMVQTSPSPATACSIVTFHVVATNTSIAGPTGISVELYSSVPGITPSSVTPVPSSSSLDGGGIWHFTYDFPLTPISGIENFDFSYKIPCDFIPTSSTGTAMGIYNTYGTITTVGLLSYSMPPLITTYNWVNLFLVVPPADVSSHIGETVTRSIRVDCGSNAAAMVVMGDIQFEDIMASSCNMGAPQSVTMQIYNASGIAVGGPVINSTPSSGNRFDFLSVSLNSDNYIIFTEEVLIVADPTPPPPFSTRPILDRCINSCGSTSTLHSDILIHWGCAGEPMCHFFSLDADIDYDGILPVLRVTQTIAPPIPDVTCMDGSPLRVQHTKVLWNDGDANLYDIEATLGTQLGSLIPSTEFVFTNEISVSDPLAIITTSDLLSGSHSIISTCANALTTVITGNPIKGATIQIPILEPGESVEITYYTYRCCPDDHLADALVGNYNDPEYFDIWQMTVNGFSECGRLISGIYIPNPQNQGERMIHMTQRPIPGPTHLTGTPHDCNPSNKQIYHVQNLVFCEENWRTAVPHYPLNSQFFDPTLSGIVHGTLRVRISTQQGLNVEPTSDISLWDNSILGCTVATPSLVINDVPYDVTSGAGGAGGVWTIFFPLSSLTSASTHSYDDLKAFLDGSVFNFPLTPCCSGENIPTYTLEWDINPYGDHYSASIPTGDLRSCDDCWIPLAKTTGEIHLMCPGCVTPGIIVDNVTLQRKTVGWPDVNNNGWADGPTPFADMSSMLSSPGSYAYAGRTFMPGDEISCDINVKGQDGDNTLGGFDYATLMLDWGSRPPFCAPMPNNQFNYLNMFIQNPCLPNWEIEKITLQVQIHGSGPFLPLLTTADPELDITSYNSVSGLGHFFSIPYSAVSGTGWALTEFHVDDKYKVHIDYKACLNGPAGDCEHDVQIWWSTVPHTSAAVTSFETVGEANVMISLHSPSSATDRVNLLYTLGLTNARYLCEGSGDIIHGYHITKEYNGTWSNNSDESSSATTCRKRYTSNVNLRLTDIGSGNNFFINEYRPINLNFIDEYYAEPQHFSVIPPHISVPPDYLYVAGSTTTGSILNTFEASGVSNAYSIANTGILPTENLLASSPLSIFSFSSPLTFDIAVEGVAGSPMDPAGPDATFPGLFLSDENSTLVLNHFYDPSSCPDLTLPFPDLDRSIVRVMINDNYGEVGSDYCGSSSTENLNNLSDGGFTGVALANPTPVLSITHGSGFPIRVFTIAPTCFELIITNTSTAMSANNVYLYIPAPISTLTFEPTTATPTSIVGLIPLITGASDWTLVNIPQLKPRESATISICFLLDNPCAEDDPFDFTVQYGKSCLGPILDHLLIDDGCNQQNVTVSATPADVVLTGLTNSVDPSVIAPCGTSTIKTEYWIEDIGQIANMVLSVTLPSTVGFLVPSVSVYIPGGSPDYPSYTYGSLGGSGSLTHTLTIDGSAFLDYATAERVFIEFTFQVGSCASGSFTPQIRLEATTYCTETISYPEVPDFLPISSIVINPSLPSLCPAFLIEGVKTNASCLGALDGAIDLSLTPVSGSPPLTPPYTYLWSPGGMITEDVTGLGVGTYIVTVTDPFNCTYSKDFSITAPKSKINLPTAGDHTFTTCDLSGTATFIPHPGSSYTYSWYATNAVGTTSGTLTSGILTTPSITFADASLGSMVTIRATDAGGCYDEIKIWIEPCCDMGEAGIPYPLISNTSASAYFAIPSGSGVFNLPLPAYRINGTFIIDHDLNITGNRLYMEPYSQIIVNPGIHLSLMQHATLIACDTTMWKGIIISSTGLLTVSGSRVYDALTAITCSNGAQYDIITGDFNRNWVNIDVLPNTISPNPSTIKFSNFFCHTELVPWYGKTIVPTDGTMWSPHRSEKTFKGINIINNYLLNIGLPGSDPYSGLPYSNFFSDMNYGIYSVNSALEVMNNHFDNLRQITGPPTSAGDGINFGIDGSIGTYAKNLHSTLNQYNSIPHACIYLYGSETQTTIEDENMTGVFGILSNNLGTKKGYTSSPDPCDYKPIIIRHNIINYGGFAGGTDQGAGIKLENSYRINARIYDGNILNGPNYDMFFPNSFGIYISHISVISKDVPRFSITGNFVHKGRVGISAQNMLKDPSTTCASYTNNIVLNTIDNFDATANHYIGIGLVNANNINVSCNTITGLLAFKTTSGTLNQAIVLSSAQYNFVSCNTMSKFFRGFSANGICSMPNKLAANYFDNMGIHILVNASSTIGDQDNMGTPASPIFHANYMQQIAPSGGVINNSTTPFKYAYKTLLPNNYNPILRGGFGGPITLSPPYAPYPDALTNYGCIVSCTVPLAPPSSGGSGSSRMSSGGTEAMDFALTLKENADISSELEEEGNQKLNEEILYSMVKDDSLLKENDTLEAFYVEKSDAHTGKLSIIQELIDEEQYVDASDELSILPLTNEAEQANKTVYEIVLNVEQREKYLLDEEEMNVLQYISKQCPIIYGQAVFTARVLVSSQYGYEASYWDDEELCTDDLNYRKSKANKIHSDSLLTSQSDFMIYPNPASTELNFKLLYSSTCINGSNSIIEILDVLGNRVWYKEYNGYIQFGKINTQFLANGSYLIKYSCSNEQKYQQIFVINK